MRDGESAEGLDASFYTIFELFTPKKNHLQGKAHYPATSLYRRPLDGCPSRRRTGTGSPRRTIQESEQYRRHHELVASIGKLCNRALLSFIQVCHPANYSCVSIYKHKSLSKLKLWGARACEPCKFPTVMTEKK